jgi:hypothetical protein
MLSNSDDVGLRCTLWPSSGLRVLADGFTVQHTAPAALRPLTAFLGSPLAHVNGYFEVRVLHLGSTKGGVKVGLYDPGASANRSRACPTVDDMAVSLSSDTGLLTIKHGDGTKRSSATTFRAGDTIGFGVFEAQGSSPSSRSRIVITRNGKLVEAFTVPASLCKDPLALHPIVSLAAAGDFVCLDVRSSWPDTTATLRQGLLGATTPTNSRPETPLSAQALGRRSSIFDTLVSAGGGAGGGGGPGGGVGGGEGGVGGGGAGGVGGGERAKLSGTQLIFDCKHFEKHRLGSHLTVHKVALDPKP